MVRVLEIDGSHWLGNHSVQFHVFLMNIDPDATLPWLIEVTMTLEVQFTAHTFTANPAPISED